MAEVISLEAFRNAKAQQQQVVEQKAPESSAKVVGGVFDKKIVDDDVFDYEHLTAMSLLALVRSVLREVQVNGMPKKSKIVLAFNTRHPGVKMDQVLRSQYQDAMTIMLDQWWDNLDVGAGAFGVTLNFNDVGRHIVIPFDALISFYDEGADFGIGFKNEEPAPSIA